MSTNFDLIRCVGGDVPADVLGHVQCHAYIWLEKGASYEVNPELCMDDHAKSLAELNAYRAAGGGRDGRVADGAHKEGQRSGGASHVLHGIRRSPRAAADLPPRSHEHEFGCASQMGKKFCSVVLIKLGVYAIVPVSRNSRQKIPSGAPGCLL